MADSLGEARRALRDGETGEALVHLWNALEQTRGTADERTIEAIAELGERVAAEGDEGERVEAERLLDELARADESGDAAATTEADDAEEWVLEHATPSVEPAPLDVPPVPPVESAPRDETAEDAEPEAQSRRRVPIGALIWLAFIVYAIVRTVGG